MSVFEEIIRAFFDPAGLRAPARRAPAAHSIACPLSSRCASRANVAVWCGLMPSTTSDCFSSPVQCRRPIISICGIVTGRRYASVLQEQVFRRVDCVQAQTRMLPSLVEGFHAYPMLASSLLQVHGLPNLSNGARLKPTMRAPGS